jgi:hypothetical protein
VIAERRHVTLYTAGPVAGPGLYYLLDLDPSFIMMMAWGLVPGDDSEACLYLELVLLGCEKKRQKYHKKKKNVALVVVQYTGMYCMASTTTPRTGLSSTISANRCR